MNPEAPDIIVAQIIVLVLSPVVLFAPIRWAILAWLVTGVLNPSPDAAASSVIGTLNAAKAIAFPAILLLRMRALPKARHGRMRFILAAAMVGYCLIASLWSPFPLAAAKMTAHFAGIVMSFLVLGVAGERGLLSRKLVIGMLAISIVLAAVETFGFTSPTFAFEWIDRPLRFTAFVAPQQFAPLLVVFFVLALALPISTWLRLTLCGLCGAALLMNGSRTWFLSAMIATLIFFALHGGRSVKLIWASFAGATVTGVLLFFSFSPMGFPAESNSNRLLATILALGGGESSERIGLENLDFRLGIYRTALEQLSESGTTALMFGHGTSSGGNLIAMTYPGSYRVDSMDANRSVHNEWIRVLYEFGIFGLALFIGLLWMLGLSVLRAWRTSRHPVALASLALFPAFLLALSSENILAGAGNSVTLSLALAVALGEYARHAKPQRQSMEAR